MRRVEASVVINRPLEEVFAFVRNPVDHPQWETAQFDVEQTSEGPMGVGTTFRGGIRLLGLPIGWTAECTGYDPTRQLEFRVNAAPLQLQEILTLEPIEAGTSFTIVYKGDLRGLFRLAGPIVVRVFQRQVESDLANLRHFLEAPAIQLER
ncbi:MAG: hypothetical protein GTN93_16860 [Anaerolineae bacterium]|nr:hypothetical protein [Anaerolineae bacterium]